MLRLPELTYVAINWLWANISKFNRYLSKWHRRMWTGNRIILHRELFICHIFAFVMCSIVAVICFQKAVKVLTSTAASWYTVVLFFGRALCWLSFLVLFVFFTVPHLIECFTENVTLAQNVYKLSMPSAQA